MVTLDTVRLSSAPSTMKLSDFKVGEKVDVTYTQSDGKMEISAMKPAA